MRRELTACLTAACVVAAAGLGAQDPTTTPDREALARFLMRARLEGYASGDTKRIERLPDGGSEVRSQSDGLTYRDRWYGEDRFAGEELVWHKGHAIWSMNFYGATAQGAPETFPAFHKSALRRATPEAPFRGPAFHREGDFVYVNTWTGTIDEFEGVERVFLRDKEIFRLTYHGGRLRS